jgi:LPS-assembly protein
LEGRIKNTNYDAKNTTNYKTESTVNELSSVISFKSSLPMKKDGERHSKIFTPNFMIRYAPFHMRDLSGDSTLLNYTNLYSTNKTSIIEDGLSTVLGFDYKINQKNEKNEEKEKLTLSMGQVFNARKNKKLPARSSLDQRMSDLVGKINYNFSELASVNYKFSVDHNYNDINYSEVSSVFNFGKIGFNLDYLEQQNHVGNEHYVNAGISINLTDNSKFNFKTKKNFQTSSTELYDLSYQYSLDCLTAGVVYRREFYEDSDIEKKDSLMFKITFVPFGGAKTPTFINP